MRLTPPSDETEDPGQFWKDFIRDTAPVFRKPTIEQLEGFIAPTFEALCDGARYVDERLVEIIDEVRPDAIVEDNVVSFPALPASGVPWVRIVSCNPAELKDALVPPPSPATGGGPLALGRLSRRVRGRSAAAAVVRRVLPRARRAGTARTRVRPPRPISTSGSIRRRWTTRASAGSATPGTTSSRASGRPTPSGGYRSRSRARTARSSISASARSARPTSS